MSDILSYKKSSVMKQINSCIYKISITHVYDKKQVIGVKLQVNCVTLEGISVG